MKYFKKLVGEKVYLSPPREEDIEKYTKWLNDFNTTDYLGRSSKICTVEAEKEWYDSPVFDGKDHRQLRAYRNHGSDVSQRTPGRYDDRLLSLCDSN